MRFPDYARQKVEEAPEKWFEPYEKARADGDWRAPEALRDRIYGRPAQASMSQDLGEIDSGDVVEIRRMLLERIRVERADELSRES
jgi:hypothetical protein